MLDKYQEWIDANVSTNPATVRGRCGVVAAEMIEAFPELRMRHGTFGAEPHWWCVDTSGAIVDPTRHQFAFEGEYNGTAPVRYTDTADGRVVPRVACRDAIPLLRTGPRSRALRRGGDLIGSGGKRRTMVCV